MKKGQFKDIIICAVILFILIAIAIAYFWDANGQNILIKLSTYIGTVVIILFGIIGVFEYAFDNGLNFLVPNSYKDNKEKKQREQTKHYLDEFFLRETAYFMQYGNKRIEFFLNQVGLKKSEFEKVKLNILKIKLLPLSTLDDARDKISQIIQQENVVLSQKNKLSTDLVYKEVKYFINFTDIMYSEDYANELSDCFSLFIKDNLGSDILKINKIVIPYNSNLLLGLEVSRKMNIALVRVTELPKILHSQSWEGTFSESGGSSVIVLHDVLVSGDQVIKSIEKLPNNCSVEAIFCLINRLDFKGKAMLESKGYKVSSLIDLSDIDIEKMLKGELTE